MTLGGITFFVIVNRMGGFSNAVSKVDSGLLMQAAHIKTVGTINIHLYAALCWYVFRIFFSHFLTAKEVGSFRYAIILYPVCIAIVWIPSVLLGILGNVDAPGLKGSQANNVLIQMIHIHAPGVLAGFFRGWCVSPQLCPRWIHSRLLLGVCLHTILLDIIVEKRFLRNSRSG